jgi:hypothetical protein
MSEANNEKIDVKDLNKNNEILHVGFALIRFAHRSQNLVQDDSLDDFCDCPESNLSLDCNMYTDMTNRSYHRAVGITF